MRIAKTYNKTLFVSSVAIVILGMNRTAVIADAMVVSFSYDANSSNQYTLGWPDYEEDTIFAPNAEDNPPRLGAPRPGIRFLGKGARSAIDVDATSYGYSEDPIANPDLSIYFSVSADSIGQLNTAVRTEPLADRSSDIFRSMIDRNNHQLYDGNGLNMQPGSRKLGLMENMSTHIDALDMRAAWDQNLGQNSLDDERFYWSVIDANGFGGRLPQGEYSGPGYSGRDVFVGQPQNSYSNNIAGIDKYADGGDLGLTAGDDIDGLVVVDLDANPDDFDPLKDLVYFSLNRPSESLSLPDFAAGAMNKSGADIFFVGKGQLSPVRLYSATDLGLAGRWPNAGNPLPLSPLSGDEVTSFDFAQHSMVSSAMVPEPSTLVAIVICAMTFYIRGKK